MSTAKSISRESKSSTDSIHEVEKAAETLQSMFLGAACLYTLFPHLFRSRRVTAKNRCEFSSLRKRKFKTGTIGSRGNSGTASPKRTAFRGKFSSRKGEAVFVRKNAGAAVRNEKEPRLF